MLYALAFVLFAVWLIGLVGAYTFGGLLHILLVFAVIVAATQLLVRKK